MKAVERTQGFAWQQKAVALNKIYEEIIKKQKSNCTGQRHRHQSPIQVSYKKYYPLLIQKATRAYLVQKKEMSL